MEKLHESLSSGYSLRIGEYVKRAWEIFKMDAGIYIGMQLFSFVLSFAGSLIPFVGIFSGIILMPYNYGFFLTAQKNDRGEHQTFSGFFDGYKKGVELIGAGVISFLIICVALVPLLFLIDIGGIFSILSENAGNETELASNLMYHFLGKIWIIFAYIFVLSILSYLAFSWIGQLILFKDKSIGESIQISSKLGFRNIGDMMLLFLTIIGINILGLICLIVGLFITIPMTYIMLYLAFKDIAIDDENSMDSDNLNEYLVS